MNLNPKKILYVGSLAEETNSFKRFATLKKMGHQVEGIDVDPYIFVPFWLRFHYHLFFGPGINALNKAVFEKVKIMSPDILYVDNKPYLKSSVLRKIKSLFPDIKIVNVITDDPCGRYSYCWRRIYHTFKNYDIHFVQRQINVTELKKLGAKRVEICYRSFDPVFHRVLSDTKNQDAKKTVVGFVGSYEEEREVYIAFLVQNGIDVEITGNGWHGGKYWDILKPFYKGPSVYGDDYIKVINKMDIALHFLRKANRDQQDSRTFEIPACGAFMLAERSHLHQQFFEEGEEADFFTSKEELLKKVLFYLDNPELRLQIAKSGFDKSYAAGYDHQSRLTNVLETIYREPVKKNKYKRIVAGIYYDPEFYPPTINAINNLSEICEELVVVTRNHSELDFPSPGNVRLIKLGPLMSVQESEKKSLHSKIISFVNYTFTLWKYTNKKDTDLAVYYDAIPLLSFFVFRKFISRKKLIWYHNHDMPGSQLHLIRKYSIGWFSSKYEKSAMNYINFFSLPSDDRLAYYPNWNRMDDYFLLPNYPSLKLYKKRAHHGFINDEIKIIFQGTIGEDHGLEELVSILNHKINNNSLRLILKGSVRPHYKKSLTEQAVSLGVADKLEWIGLGPYCELPALTTTCHIGIAVYTGTDSVRKTLGTASNKIYEYAASGLPIILFENEQFRKYLSGYSWAFFSDATAPSFEDCIKNIVNNYAEYSKQSRIGFESGLNFESEFYKIINRLLSDLK